mgnify:CR=1 FL=1
MSMTGSILFGVGGIGIAVGFFTTAFWTLEQLRETDTRANEMISPSMPPAPPVSPPPAPPPPSPPVARRRALAEGNVFKFTAAEEKKIMNDVRGSLLGMPKKL